MPVTPTRRTPGVYSTEEDAYPPSIIGLETAVPAFIGYTEHAVIGGRPVYFAPQQIRSMADYEAIFGGPFKPRFDIEIVDMESGPPGTVCYDFSVVNKHQGRAYYRLNQRHEPHFMLYYGMQLFFNNGGGECYVTSCGSYATPNDLATTAQVTAAKLEQGLIALSGLHGPTMVVIPDAILLDKPQFQSLTRKMLKHCADLQDRVAILDVWGSGALNMKDQTAFDREYPAVIKDFRDAVGTEHLSYGVAYFPFLKTSVVGANHVNYQNIATDSSPTLAEVLTTQTDALYPKDPQNGLVRACINRMATADKPETVQSIEQDLKNELPVLREVEKTIVKRLGVLPPGAAIAGIYARNDITRGVWNAPADIAFNETIGPSVLVDDEMQEDLNAPLDGKAINAIRHFLERGTIVWGARTLDGNSRDWRYIQTRRTVIYIEQSLKRSLNQLVFAANDHRAWTAAVSMTSGFLRQLWIQGALMGSNASEAFTVECGLDSTMTDQNILDGYMIVQVTLQMLRPAEFIELTFKQKMQSG